MNFLINDPAYIQNPLRQDLFRAGHAHAGTLLVLSLITLKYVDEASLSERWKGVVRHCIPLSAILLPAGFFFSVLQPNAKAPNSFINLVYAGAALLALGMLVLGIGLTKRKIE
jgi:ABC-type multidrug transport system permease subunit